MMIGWTGAARPRAVFHASSVASSTTGTPPSARSREASRAIDRCGSASIMVGRRPVRCQWTARQLASVLLPLPPFIVATVIICLMSHLPFRLISVRRIVHDAIGFLAEIPQMTPELGEYSRFFPASLQDREVRFEPLPSPRA